MKSSNKKLPISFAPLLSLLILLPLSLSLVSCNNNVDTKKPKEKTQVQRGKELYDKYCISCHGMHGDGVEASKLEVKPPDLTKITYRRRAKNFPIADIARFIDGRQFAKSHGDREMPIWGKVFTEQENMDSDQLKGTLGDIIGYLISIQE